MATKNVFLSGKAMYAKLRSPDTAFGQNAWKMTLYLDPESLAKVMELKEQGLMNVIKKDDEGYSVSLKRNTTLQMRNGNEIPMTPPIIIDGTKTLEDGSHPLLAENVWIGNGSDVTVKMQVYTYSPKFSREGTKKGTAMRLESVIVHNLIPYVPIQHFDEAQLRQTKGLMDQRPPEH